MPWKAHELTILHPVRSQLCDVTWWPCPSQSPCYDSCGTNNISLHPSAPVDASMGIDTCGQRPPYKIQGCPWNSNLSTNALGSRILNQTLQVILPGSLSYPEYPIPCSPGIRGATADDISGQSSPICAGFCDAGFYCPYFATIDPLPCPAGRSCPRGRGAGRWLRSTGNKSPRRRSHRKWATIAH